MDLPWTKPTSFDDVENRGILAGTEENGNNVYVGRTYDKDGNFIIAKVVPALKSSFYAYNGTEESSDELEILDNAANCHWVKSDGKPVEDAAVVNGFYIGRALHNGNIVVGRVDVHKKELIGSYGGSAFNLPSYDVLIYKSKGVVYETIQKASNVTRSPLKIKNGIYDEAQIEKDNYNNIAGRIRSLEMEKSNYLRDKQSFEQRLDFEQRKVSELSMLVKKMKIENARYFKERSSFEQKFATEQQKASQSEQKLREYALNNSYLMKKIYSLEEAVRSEKLLVESIAEKLSSSHMYSNSLSTRVTDFEDTIKTQQEKIFELESEIMMTSSSSESMLKRVSDYEETIKYLRIQIEVIERKLEISCNDNDYLIERLSMLTKTLRSYQNEIDNLTNKLQSSKTVIASTHAELSRVSAQVSKYQAAVSSCYALNGDLMTKVSGLNSLVQHQAGADSSYHLINYTSEFGYGSKSSVYNKTTSFMEVPTSDSYEEIQPYGNGQPERFTPFLPTEEATPYSAQPERFTPFLPTEEFTPYSAKPEAQVNGVGTAQTTTF